jgi:cytochrome d ubiquinol oxidase subunit II
VAFSNFIRGVPLDANMNYVGGFWNLLNGYALLGGLLSVLLFTLHGAAFLTLKIEGELEESAYSTTRKLWLPVFVALGGFTIASYSATDFMNNGWNLIIAIITLVLVLVSGWLIRVRETRWVFVLGLVTILLFSAFFFVGLYPRLLVSNTNPAWSLTISNSASGPYTLRIMTIVAAIFVPIVLLYQGWTYWIFRKRISEKTEGLEY